MNDNDDYHPVPFELKYAVNVKYRFAGRLPTMPYHISGRRGTDMNDHLTMFRVGDFYELHGKDAEIAAKVLQLTLMYQNRKGVELAMCGFPHHSLEGHLRTLLNKKYKVAIADGTQRKETE